jgi:uncharacterized membrane protein
MKKTSTGLEENIAGLLCYVLGWVSGLVFLLIEKDNKSVRFHAFQSCIVFGISTVLLIIFSFWLWVLYIIIWVLSVVLWVFLMYKAYQGTEYKLPWAGNLAEKWAGHETAGGTDSAQALRSLAELRDEGVLTDEEYERKKNQVLQEAASAEIDTSPDEKIRKLAELRNEGILTDQEYEQKKSEIEREAVTAEKIKKLDELRDEGILTDEEYEQKKSQILKGSG